MFIVPVDCYIWLAGYHLNILQKFSYTTYDPRWWCKYMGKVCFTVLLEWEGANDAATFALSLIHI